MIWGTAPWGAQPWGTTTAEAAAEANLGDVAVTLGEATISSAGTKASTGSLAATLGAVTPSSDGTKGSTGTLSATLGDVTASIAGSKGSTGTLSATLAAATIEASGSSAGAPISGDLAVTLSAATLAAAGTKGSAGSLSATLGAVTVSAAASVGARGLEEAIYATLAGDGDVAELLGTRIYPVEAPQGTDRPFAIFARQKQQTLGTLNGGATHREVEVAVMVFGDSAGQAMAAGRVVRNALDGHQDTTMAAVRLVERSQVPVGEVGADPVPIADAMLFRIITAAAA